MDSAAAPDAGPPGTRNPPGLGDLGPATPLKPWEIAAVVVLGALSAIVVAVFAEGIWFQKDAWDYLAFRELSSFSSLLEPHGDHLVLPTAALMRALYETVGIDFWPWFYLPRLVGHVLMVAALWVALRRRGADRWVALGTFVVLLFMGTSSWQMPSTIGNLIVFPTIWFAALLIWKVPQPALRHRLALFALLLFGISANSMGVSAVAGFGLATLLYRRVLQWWPSIAAVGLIYVAWYLEYRGFGATSGAAAPEPLAALDAIAEIVGDAFTLTLGLPEILGIGFVLASVVVVGWLLKTGRIDVFDAALLLTLAGYFVLIISIRFTGGAASPDHVRWSQRVALLILPVLVPRLHVGRAAWARVALAVVFVVALAGNVIALEHNLGKETERATLRRSFAESAAQLVGAGEPYTARRRLNQIRTGQLTAADLERLVDDGWQPSRDWGREAEEDARARLRMQISGSGRIRGAPPITTLPLVETDVGSCLTVSAGEEAEFLVRRPGTVRLVAEPRARVDLVWEDEFGVGIWQRADVSLRRDVGFVTLMEPATKATLTVVSRDFSVEVCGLRSG